MNDSETFPSIVLNAFRMTTIDLTAEFLKFPISSPKRIFLILSLISYFKQEYHLCPIKSSWQIIRLSNYSTLLLRRNHQKDSTDCLLVNFPKYPSHQIFQLRYSRLLLAYEALFLIKIHHLHVPELSVLQRFLPSLP